MLHSDSEEELEKSDSEEEIIIESKSFGKSFQEIIEERLSAFVKEDDPYRAAKQLEIKRWYWRHNRDLKFNDKEMEALSTILTDDNYWEKNEDVDDASSVKLNRHELGKALVTLKDGDSYLFSNFERYRVAYRGCFEEDMRNIFTEMYEKTKRESIYKDYSVEKFIYFITEDKGLLMTFWSYMINQQSPEILSRFKKLIGLSDIESLDDNKQRVYEYGFRCAIQEQSLEALKFFWNQLPEKKEELLIEAALGASEGRSYYYYDTNIISWCLNNLDASKQHELLTQNLQQKKYYSILNALNYNYFFKDVEVLISRFQPQDLTKEQYGILMYSIGDKVIRAPKDFVEAGSNLLIYLWQHPGFEKQRQHYLSELGEDVAISHVLMDLVKIGVTDPVWEILNAASPEQFEKFMACSKIHDMCSNLCDSGKVQTLVKLFSYFKNQTRVIQLLYDLDPDVRKKVHEIMDTPETKGLSCSPRSNRSLETLTQSLAAFKSIRPVIDASNISMVEDSSNITIVGPSGDSISQLKP